MGRAHPSPYYRAHNDRGENDRERNHNPSALRHDVTEPDIQALMEENTQLRRLVAELSRLVAKNVMTRR